MASASGPARVAVSRLPEDKLTAARRADAYVRRRRGAGAATCARASSSALRSLGRGRVAARARVRGVGHVSLDRVDEVLALVLDAHLLEERLVELRLERGVLLVRRGAGARGGRDGGAARAP
eukprot:2753315-Prymnesium_polylepis.1